MTEENQEQDEIKTEDEPLESSYHTLFKEKVKEHYIENKKKGTFKKVKAFTKYRMFVDTFGETETGLHKVYNELWDAKEGDKLELRIHSYGGYVNEGAQFFNIITNKFHKNCTTILDSCGFSMGAIVFSLGTERIITERSELMYHDYSGASWGKGGEQKSQLKHTSKHIRNFFKDVIVDNGFLTKKEYKKMCIGEDFWMGPEELCKRGIATHVLLHNKKITAKKYLKYLKALKKR